MRIDVQGAATIRQICPQALLIFLTPESEESLIERLRIRKSETPEGIKLRRATARQEMKRAAEFDYVLINRDMQLEEPVDTIHAIILAEHHRTQPRQVHL